MTNTGTIHADVPLEALKLKFLWQSSRPRYLSDVELPGIKEGHAGAFSISGPFGPDAKRKKEKKEKPMTLRTKMLTNKQLTGRGKTGKDLKSQTIILKSRPKAATGPFEFHTQRGVILLNVDPSMAPNDLRERPLTKPPKRSCAVAMVLCRMRFAKSVRACLATMQGLCRRRGLSPRS